MGTMTDADIESFRKALDTWQERLGLKDWRVVFSPKRAKNVMAQMDKWNWPQRQVTCRVGLDWMATPVTDVTINQTAAHELLHVLLYELIQSARNPSITDDDLASIEHRVINTLEVLLVPGRE